MAKKITFTVDIPRKARRAIELYSVEFNFRAKAIDEKKSYTRKEKHKKRLTD